MTNAAGGIGFLQGHSPSPSPRFTPNAVTRASALCRGACRDPRLTARSACLGPPACDRGGTRVPIRTALVVFAIVRLAGDAANAQRLTGGEAFPIDRAKLRAVAKLHEVAIAENVGVCDDTHGDQAAAPQQIKAATVHRKHRTGHLGLRQNEPRREGRFLEGIKIWLTRGADNAGHQHPAGAGIAGVLNQRRNGPLRAAALVLVPVMNEAEIRRVDIGAIAVPQSLVGRRRLPSREYGGGNGASGSRERQERGRVIKPMLSLPARGFVPASGRCRPISFTSARRARRLIGDGPVLSGSIGTVVDGF